VRRAPRTAPGTFRTPTVISKLRLTTGHQAAGAAKQTATTPEQIESVNVALAGIHDLLWELEETLSARMPPRRVSPGQLASLQGRLDQAIGAIDDIVNMTCIDGQRFLAGDWRIVLTAEPSSPTFQIASVAPKALGNGAKSRLSDVLSGGPRDLFHASLADVREIIAQAAAQVALQQRQLASFIQRPAIISDAAIRVAAENRAAADQATSDLDLVLATSQLTRGHLLAATQSP
jgi:hypothetical protein